MWDSKEKKRTVVGGDETETTILAKDVERTVLLTCYHIVKFYSVATSANFD